MAVTRKSRTKILIKRQKRLIPAQEPTEEDMARTFTTEELIQLCQRTRCRVDVWKWNAVHILSRELHRLGKFKGKSQSSIDEFLIQTYLRNPHLFKYIEREKQIEWILEWRQRKKRSLLKLDKWKQSDMQMQ